MKKPVSSCSGGDERLHRPSDASGCRSFGWVDRFGEGAWLDNRPYADKIPGFVDGRFQDGTTPYGMIEEDAAVTHLAQSSGGGTMESFRRSTGFVLVAVVLWIVFPLTVHALPSWVESPHENYPDDRYFTAVGSGPSLEVAKKKATAGISKIIAQSVQVDETLVRKIDERFGPQGRLREKIKMQTEINVRSEMDVRGVTIQRATYHSGTDEHFALAVMDRRKAAKAYARRLEEAQSQKQKHYDQAMSSDHKIDRLRHLVLAREHAVQERKSRQVLEQVRLEGTGGEMASERSVGESEAVRPSGPGAEGGLAGRKENFEENADRNLRRMEERRSDTDSGGGGNAEASGVSTDTRSTGPAETTPASVDLTRIDEALWGTLRELTVYVESPTFSTELLDESFRDRIRHRIGEQFTSLNFRTVDSSEEAGIHVTSTFSASETSKGRKSDRAIRWNLELTIRDVETNHRFATLSRRDVVVGVDWANARDQTKFDVGQWIEEEVPEWIETRVLKL